MLYSLLHKLIVALYLGLPIAAVWVDARLARRRGRAAPSAMLALTLICAAMLGTGVSMLYAYAVGGKLIVWQVAKAAYFATGLLILLKIVEALLRVGWVLLTAAPRATSPNAAEGQPPAATSPRLRWLLDATGFIIRTALLVIVGLPCVMATVMTYRPKVGPLDDPQKQLGYPFDRVSFRTSDGMNIVGWWIPAVDNRRRSQRRSGDFGKNTVIVCHGLASNKSNQLILSRGFVPYGYNVLIFDFRAHGESDGQLSSFGDLERRDVLAAVKWVRENHPNDSQHLYGVGASMGGAALIAAAADPSPDGQAIEAVAVYGTYDSLQNEFESVAHDRFIAPMRWLLERFAMPIASAQVGTDLSAFSPADLSGSLWPRPIMVIHGVHDQIIDFERGRALFDAASQPKQRLWIDGADHNGIINDEDAARRVREFFHSAEPNPII